MASPYCQIFETEFSGEEGRKDVKECRLHVLEIAFGQRCSYHCVYCPLLKKPATGNTLNPVEIRDTILQAKDLGAKRITIIGGEAIISPHTCETIRFIKMQGLEAEVFTNGTHMDPDLAGRLFRHGVRVVLMMDTRNEELQDKLSGKKGAFKVIQQAFDNLKKAGYPSASVPLSVSTVICRQNIDELATMWQWLRDQDIAPSFKCIAPYRNGKGHEWLSVDHEKLRAVFAQISEIDRVGYYRRWLPQPPLVGGGCMRHQFSCLVASQGDVLPCIGISIPIGNIRDQKLVDILRASEILEDLKNHRRMIKGPCHSCDNAGACYGCRGTAYQLTGDYLASDPLCWLNVTRQAEIDRLPLPIHEIIPQRPPMRVVDTLLKSGERSAEVSAKVTRDMPFVDPDGVVDETVYLEMMAQSIAALNGFKQAGTSGLAPEGYLLGANRLKILETAKVGDILNISVYKYAKFGDFGIIKGTISKDDRVLAQGEIKVWHQTGVDQ